MSASRQELSELLVTKYVPNNGEKDEEETIEEHRAGGDLDIDGRYDDNDIEDGVCLVEDRPLHRMSETPKLIAKPAKESKLRDEAVKVLRKLRNEPAESLREEKYEYMNSRWFNTTRESEMELIEHVLVNPNARPQHFAIQSRRISISDVEQLILESLFTAPQNKGQSLARFAIKTTEEMSFKDLWQVLKNLKEQNDSFEISDGKVMATLTEEEIRPITHRLTTNKLEEYSEFEDFLERDECGQMSARVVVTCSIRGRNHVKTNITHFNNCVLKNNCKLRTKYIELEQTVKCMNRRVVIAEDRNESVEFEVEDEMQSLQEGLPPVEDLIDFLVELKSMEEF